MTATAAGQHPAASGRLLCAPPGSDIQVWLLRHADLDANARTTLLNGFPDLLPDALPERRLAHALIHHWLGELLACPPAQLSLATRAQGKPWLPGHDLSFNVSHSRQWLALAWTRRSVEIGVDIEDLGRGQAFAALAQRYFQHNELTAWQAAADADRERLWLRTWTRKEAVLKAHGLGLRLALNTLDTRHSPVQHATLGRWAVYSSDLADAVLSVSWPA